MEKGSEIAVRDEAQLPEVKAKQESQVQAEIEKLLPLAGTIEITEIQKKILFAPVDEENVEIRPDGLVYLPWMEYVTRLRDAFGVSWAIIPKGTPNIKDNIIYWGWYLVIQGKPAGFAVGEQKYIPSNFTMTYGDALEGAKSNALMRLCKGLGISLELWKPSFIREWKNKNAEEYYDKDKKKKLWRKKNQINGEMQVKEAEVVEEVLNGADPKESVDQPPPASSTKTKNFNFLKSMSDAKKALGEEKYYEILTGQYGHLHANLVTAENEQTEIYNEMKKAYKEKAKGEKK